MKTFYTIKETAIHPIPSKDKNREKVLVLPENPQNVAMVSSNYRDEIHPMAEYMNHSPTNTVVVNSQSIVSNCGKSIGSDAGKSKMTLDTDATEMSLSTSFENDGCGVLGTPSKPNVSKRSLSSGSETCSSSESKYKQNLVADNSNELEMLDQLVHSVSLQSSQVSEPVVEAVLSRSKDIPDSSIAHRDIGSQLNSSITSALSSCSSSSNAYGESFHSLNKSTDSGKTNTTTCSNESALARRRERHNYLMKLAVADDCCHDNENSFNTRPKPSRSRSRSVSRSREGSNRPTSNTSRSSDKQQLKLTERIGRPSRSATRCTSSRSRTRSRSVNKDSKASLCRSKSGSDLPMKSKNMFLPDKNSEPSYDENQVSLSSFSEHSVHVETSTTVGYDGDDSFQRIGESKRRSEKMIDLLKNDELEDTSIKSNCISVSSPITVKSNAGVVVVQKNGVVVVEKVGNDCLQSDVKKVGKSKSNRRVNDTLKLASFGRSQTRGRSKRR